MGKNYFTAENFNNTDLSEKLFSGNEYENCNFSNCNFSGADLTEVIFEDCCFTDCDFSMAQLKKTAFRDVKFKNSKLLGVHFDECNPFLLSFMFESCNLDYSSFARLKIRNTVFENCKMEETDFAEANLSYAIFKNCDLTRAVFDNTLLEYADFRTSFNFSIDPENNHIRKARFSVNNIAGLLEKYDIDIE
jgi:uncharacterized protein YjbI with pentapeptide repeats